MTWVVSGLRSEHIQWGAELIREAFPHSESEFHVLGIGPDYPDTWMREAYLPERCSASPGSLVAATADGTLAGLLTLEDLSAEEDTGGEEPSASDADMNAKMEAFGALSQECKSIFWRELAIRASSGGGGSASGACFDGDSDAALLLQRPGHVVAFGFLATAPEFRRKGLASTLIRTGAEQALAQGFVWGFAICNEQSLPVFARHGFERWGGLEYATFEHGGRRWFEGMPAHLKGMNVMAARLADVVAMLPQ